MSTTVLWVPPLHLVRRTRPNQPIRTQTNHCKSPNVFNNGVYKTATDDTLRKSIWKGKVKWPKANDKQEWRSFDQSLHTVLHNLIKGSTTAKLNIFEDVVYKKGKERFGEPPKRKTSPPKQSGRREREILQLVTSPPPESLEEGKGPREGGFEELVGSD